jgi:competence protein ComEA
MVEHFRERVRELAVRAGLAGVPEPVLMAVLILVVVVCFVVGVRTWQTYAPEPASSSAGAGASGGQAAAGTGAGSKAKDPGSGHSAGAPGAASSQDASQVVVYVSGSVRKPAVYRLASGSRVADAIAAAGGTSTGADCSQVNLARVVKDGEQLTIPKAGERQAAPTGSATSGGSGSTGPTAGGATSGSPSGGAVDLNTADEAALDALPGVGPSTAKKIVADREKNGPFKSAQDLMRVAGIGPKKFDSLKDLVTVGP